MIKGLSLAASQSEDKMKCGLLCNVVIAKSATILKLLASKDESLLIRWDTFLVLDLCLDVVDCVRSLDIESDGLAGQGLHEDLHTSSESQNEMKSRLLLDVVIAKSATILKLLASKDESLLIRRDSFLVLDLSLDVVNGVRCLHIKCDSLASKCLYEDLHCHVLLVV